MPTSTIEVGRVLRVGRGWADVSINRKTRRVRLRAEVPVRVGGYLKIVQDQAIGSLPGPHRMH